MLDVRQNVCLRKVFVKVLSSLRMIWWCLWTGINTKHNRNRVWDFSSFLGIYSLFILEFSETFLISWNFQFCLFLSFVRLSAFLGYSKAKRMYLCWLFCMGVWISILLLLCCIEIELYAVLQINCISRVGISPINVWVLHTLLAFQNVIAQFIPHSDAGYVCSHSLVR